MTEAAGTVGVKYCGGCNPRFDRAALVRRLAAAWPGGVLAPARPGIPYHRLLVVCGCAAQCADHSAIEAAAVFSICAEADFDAALAFLTKGLDA